MPTYDLLCLDCGDHFEVEQADAPESARVRCPACRSTLVRQTFESHLRNALARPKADLEELRACHRG